MAYQLKVPKILMLAAAALLAFVAAFGWGYVAHRNMVFPYNLVRDTAIEIGLTHPKLQKDFEIFSKPMIRDVALGVLGYVGGTYDDQPEISGVTHIDRDRAFRGPRIYTSILSSRTFLVDVDGAVLHEWGLASAKGWVFSRLLEDGGIVVVERDRSLLRVDRDSAVLWSVPVRAHHDFDVWNDTIVALTREQERRGDISPAAQTILDFVSLYSLDGTLQSKISLLDALRTSDFAYLLPSVRDLYFDEHASERHKPLCPTHANHVEVIDAAETWMGKPAGRALLLISLRNINTILVMDLETHEILWAWGPNVLTYQHHPSLLSTGNVLVFNNGLERSSVLEIDPRTFDVAWRYSDPGFFSVTRGSAQRLPNGNTLITESNEGRVFEVTAGGDIVWEWKNPDVTDDGMRSAVFRMAALEKTPGWLQ